MNCNRQLVLFSILLACTGCDPIYGVRVNMKSQSSQGLACATQALSGAAIEVTPKTPESATVQAGVSFANLVATKEGYSLSLDKMGVHISCANIESASPTLKAAVKIIAAQCMGSSTPIISERWSQESCGVSIVAN
jgi:hypothetical protein